MASESPKRISIMKLKEMKRRVIILSSHNSKTLADAILNKADKDIYTMEVRTDGLREFSQTLNYQTIQYEYDFALIICGATDTLTTHKKTEISPRDTFLLELGMCINSFTPKRVIILKPGNTILLPKSVEATSIEYSLDEDINAVARTILEKVDEYINDSELAQRQHIKLSWNEYFHNMKKLTERLCQSDSMGGYEYDAIIGINRGGLMVADLIARENMRRIPVLPIFIDRRSEELCFDFSDSYIPNSYLNACLGKPEIRSILLVDSLTRDGMTVIAAKKYLEELFPKKTIKSAVIYANTRLKNESPEVLENIDYISSYKDLDGRKLSLD